MNEKDSNFKREDYNKEVDNIPAVFECLFPGCTLDSMPPTEATLGLGHFLARVHKRESDITRACAHDQDFATRWNLPLSLTAPGLPTQLILKFELAGQETTRERVVQNRFGRIDLSDLIDPEKDEKFGGVVVENQSNLLFARLKRMMILSFLRKYRESNPVYTIGILREGRPVAVIKVAEGSQPRIKKKSLLEELRIDKLSPQTSYG